jgi:hypothetical protein
MARSSGHATGAEGKLVIAGTTTTLDTALEVVVKASQCVALTHACAGSSEDPALDLTYCNSIHFSWHPQGNVGGVGLRWFNGQHFHLSVSHQQIEKNKKIKMKDEYFLPLLVNAARMLDGELVS